MWQMDSVPSDSRMVALFFLSASTCICMASWIRAGSFMSPANKKVCFYVAQYAVHWTAQFPWRFTLHPPPPDRRVHSDSTSLGSILATQQLCAKTFHSHVHHCQMVRLRLRRFTTNRQDMWQMDSVPSDSKMVALVFLSQYSFKQLIELGHRGENKNAQSSKR